MKNYLLPILLILFSLPSFGQYCPENTITTNPDNYQNSTDNSQLLKFDWRLQAWTGYRPGIPVPVSYQITSPFFNTNGNPNLRELSFPTAKNYRPEDGWEFIAKNFGVPLEGTDHPWFILYNRYNGTLRMFLQINSTVQNFQSAELRLRPTPQMRTNAVLNLLGTQTVPLGMFNKQAYQVIPNQYVLSGQGSGFNPFWTYGDIQTLYDPCVCRFNSTMNIQSELFSSWDVDLTINGTLSTKIVLNQTNSQSKVNNDNFFAGFNKFLNTSTSVVDDVKKFTDAGITLEKAGDSLGTSVTNLLAGLRTPQGDFKLKDILGSIWSFKNMFGAVATLASIFNKKSSTSTSNYYNNGICRIETSS